MSSSNLPEPNLLPTASSNRKGPPKGYIPGIGRGATGFSTRSDVGPAAAGNVPQSSGSRAAQARLQRLAEPAEEPQYTAEDDEADQIWDAIEERLRNKRKANSIATTVGDNPQRSKIGADFAELKDQLSSVTEDQWASIPDVGDHSLKHKQQHRQAETFTPLTDSLLSDMSGVRQARETVLGLSLDKMEQPSSSSSTLDADGYLTSLAAATTTPTADVTDVRKARLLLQSVRNTNPHHAPAWIAAARVEEAANQLWKARQILQQACQQCSHSPDVWLEAVRLTPQQGPALLAQAVRHNPQAVVLFLKAAELEPTVDRRKAVLRHALETNPTSVQLWKTAIDLEDDPQQAKLLLGVAVEQVPQSLDLWLALARLETYEQAQQVLNRARQALPAERAIWMAAAQLEEGQQKKDVVEKLVQRAVQSLQKQKAVVTRDQWLEEAVQSEAAGAPWTSAAIVKETVGLDVEEEDRLRTWSGDAKQMLQKGAIETARAILKHALSMFEKKRSLWNQSIELERQHGTPESLDKVLEAASERLPHVEIFWLVRAKERWVAGDVDKAREVLTEAFAANPDSETIWLAAAKLEWETGEVERARVLLQRARDRAPSARVYMKAAVLEREQGNMTEALKLVDEAIGKYARAPKLYMIGGQIHSEDMTKDKANLEKARKYFQKGLEKCSDNVVLWILASRLEERVSQFDPSKGSSVGATKARSVLELARLKNPRNPELWLEAVRLERRSDNAKMAETLMAKALQECPTSGILLAEQIRTAPRVEQKSKSAAAIQKCPDDPHVLLAVAALFASERKHDKARKWLERAVTLNPDLGDAWAQYLKLEETVGTAEQQVAIRERCQTADPKHGERWQAYAKTHPHATTLQVLEQVVLLL